MKELIQNTASLSSNGYASNNKAQEGLSVIAIIFIVLLGILFLVTLWFAANTTEKELDSAAILFFVIFGFFLSFIVYIVKVNSNVKKEVLKLRHIEIELMIKQENDRIKNQK